MDLHQEKINEMRLDMMRTDHIKRCKEADPYCVIDDMDEETEQFNVILEKIITELEAYGHDYTKEESLELMKEYLA